MWLLYLYSAAIFGAFAVTIYAAYSDWRRFSIPNYISLILVALYPVAVFTAPFEIDWLVSLAISGGIFAIGFGLFAVGIFGGGDVKFLTALSLWAGLPVILPFLVFVALAGGVLAIVIIGREAVRQSLERGAFILGLRASLRTRTPVPYGVAIALGSISIFFYYINTAGILD